MRSKLCSCQVCNISFYCCIHFYTLKIKTVRLIIYAHRRISSNLKTEILIAMGNPVHFAKQLHIAFFISRWYSLQYYLFSKLLNACGYTKDSLEIVL